MNEITNIEFEHIRLDGGTQTREQLNDSSVSEYTEAFKNGAVFPPVTVFFDGSSFWLADGFHRYSACKDAGFDSILANIINGTKRDAVLFSKGANADHGLPRSNAIKRKVVNDMLNDEEWSKWSDREIARACCVSHTFVQNLRPHLATLPDADSANAEIPVIRTVERNGKTYEQNTANIGKNVATPKPEEHKKPSPVVNPEPYVMPADDEEFPSDDLDLAQTCQDLEKERDAALELVKRYENTDVKKVVADFDGLHNRLLCETAEKNEWIKKYNFQSELLKKIRSFVGAESNSEILTKLGKS